MSNNLNLTQVTAGQNQKEVTINEQSADIDAAITEDLDGDYTSGNVTLTDAEWRENRRFNSTNLSVARVLTIPAIKKEGIIDNTDGADTLTVTVGSGTVVVAAGEAVSVKLDGTVNHIVQVGGSSGGGTQDIQEGGGSVVAAAIGSNYAAADFDVTDEGGGIAGIALSASAGAGSGVATVPVDWETIEEVVVGAGVADVELGVDLFDPTLFKEIEIVISGLQLATGGEFHMQVSDDNGISFEFGTGYEWAWVSTRADTGARQTAEVQNDADIELYSFIGNGATDNTHIKISAGAMDNSIDKAFFWQMSRWITTLASYINGAGSFDGNTSDIDAFRFLSSAGNITAGTFTLRGRRKIPLNLKINQVVRAATVVNGTLATAFANGQTIDGVSLLTDDRIMLKDQSTGAENGLYIVQPSGAPARTTDMPVAAELDLGATIPVREGDVNERTIWMHTSGTTVDTDALVFEQAYGAIKKIWIPAEVMIASIGTPVLLTQALTALQPQIRSMDFDATTDEAVQYAMVMPADWDLGTITVTFLWSHNGGATFDVVWRAAAVSIADDGAIDVAFGTQISVTDSGGTTDDQYRAVTAAVTVGGTPAEGDMVYFEFERNGLDAGTDTLDVDARLQGVRIDYTTL